MTNLTLSLQFQKSKGKPVLIDGEKIYPIYVLDLDKECSIKLKWISTQSEFKQGLQIKSDKGFIEVNHKQLTNVILWEDTSPSEVVLRYISKEGGKLKFWNVWEVEGITQAWLGNAGIAIYPSDNCIRLKCSDGNGDINLENTVVELCPL